MFARILTAVVCVAMACGSAAAQTKQDAPKTSRVKALLKEAADLMKDKQYAAALDVYDDVLILDSKNTTALVERAWILNEQGKYDAALKSALAALKVDEDNANGWTEAGYALLKQKEFKKAVDALTMAVDLNKKKWPAYDYLADAYEGRGDFDKADKVRALKKKNQNID